jgi:hypothetical protein
MAGLVYEARGINAERVPFAAPRSRQEIELALADIDDPHIKF